MHGLVAAFGSPCRHLTVDAVLDRLDGVRREDVHMLAHDAGRIAVLAPAIAGAPHPIARTAAGDLRLAVSGYLLLDSPESADRHGQGFLEQVRTRGVESALGDVVAGSFVLGVFDPASGRFTLANDRMGSIALYYRQVPDGAIVTTIPALLQLGDLAPAGLDWIACAELLHIGYTLADRSPFSGVRRLPPASLLGWNPTEGRLTVSLTGLDPLTTAPSPRPVDLHEIGERLDAACRRLTRLGGRTAHFLSGGMDSRLLLAAWPGEAPPCYSYGPAGFADVAIARAVASERGSSFAHVPLPGAAVADSLADMTRFGGVPIYPNRYLASRRIREGGFDSVVDGCLGDALFGGSYYKHQGYLSRAGQRLERLAWFKDHSVRRVGLDALVETALRAMLDAGAEHWAARALGPELSRRLAAATDDMRHDVWTDILRLAGGEDSAAIVLRNYTILNRNWHGIAQQAVMSRRFLRVYYPIPCDVALLQALLGLPPRETAFRRLEIRLLRARHPTYAALPYAASLLPLRRSFRLHHWAPALRRRLGSRVPFIRPVLPNASPLYDEWGAWLGESAELRAQAGRFLVESGLADAARVKNHLAAIAAGRERGMGDLVNMAALGHLTGTGSARAVPATRGEARP
jgi:asparagine synthetase B (glutamine-hydrolysing)